TGFNARNLCPQTTQFLPWFRTESSFTLSAISRSSVVYRCTAKVGADLLTAIRNLGKMRVWSSKRGSHAVQTGEAARVSHNVRRQRDYLAAGRACTAARGASGRVSFLRVARNLRTQCGRVPQRP